MMSLWSSPSGSASAEQTAIDLGAYARKIIDDYKNSEIDAFALRLAEEKAAKARSKASSSVNAPVVGSGGGGRAGRTGSVRLLGFKASELKVGPRDPFKVPQSIPKSLGKQITWTVQKTNSTLITTSTTAITETNISVSLSSLTQYASWTTLFDQYFIHSFSVAIEWNLPPGGTGQGQVYMAPDFDNLTNLGSIAAIEAYNGCKVFNLKPGAVTSLCCAPCAGSSVGSQTLSGLNRQWLDCAYPNITHYGIRSIVASVPATYTGVPVVTMVVAFRSGI